MYSILVAATLNMHRIVNRSYHKLALKEIKEISSRMKSYEKKMDLQVQSNQYYMIRLDGHAFSHYCRGLAKPFDNHIHLAMVHTAADLMRKFNPKSVFCFRYLQMTLMTLLQIKSFNFIYLINSMHYSR